MNVGTRATLAAGAETCLDVNKYRMLSFISDKRQIEIGFICMFHLFCVFRYRLSYKLAAGAHACV